MFSHLENGRDIDQTTFSYREIIFLVVNKHQLLCTKGTWNGISIKGHDSVFIQKQSWAKLPPVFWNSGGQHTMSECSRDRKYARIKEGKHHFMASRRELENKSSNDEGGFHNGNEEGPRYKTLIL
jgi:hypothetical protein